MALTTLPGSAEGNGRHDIASCVLLDRWTYHGYRSKVTTACSKTSGGEPISVSFCAARPPALSHIAVDVEGREAPTTDNLFMVPRVVAADADLVVLRVPRNRYARVNWSHNDYFVYRMHATRPSLHLLPRHPRSDIIGDHMVAILSCGDGNYVVATLQNKGYQRPTFVLHTCRSAGGKPPQCWTSKAMSVENPLRDTLYPVPKSAGMQGYHVTSKVIILGGDKGTVGWVDLWRGIILCDLLSDSPELRDMPLPLPAGANRTSYRNTDPCFYRDITVNKLKNTIKYIDMKIIAREVPVTPSMSCPYKLPYLVVPGSWRATTYSMPIPFSSWDDWQCDSSITSADLLPVDSPKYQKLLHKLMSSSGREKQEATEATLSLESLEMAHPTLSMGDDNIVYMLSKRPSLQGIKVVLAIDMREGTLQGVAKIDTSRHFSFNRCYLVCEISKHLKATAGTRASLGQAKKQVRKPENVEENAE